MTISITVPDASFTKNVGNVLLPFMGNAVAYHLYGDSFESSRKNLAVGGDVDLTAVGAPTFPASNYATVGYSNGFDLGYLVDYPAYTMIAVGKKNSIGGGRFFGRSGAQNRWDELTISIYLGSTFQVIPRINDSAVQAARYEDTDVGDNFFMLGGSWAGSGSQAISFMHDGIALRTGSTLVTAKSPPTVNLRMGAAGFANADTTHVAASVVYNRSLTLLEALEVRVYLKTVLLARGLTML